MEIHPFAASIPRMSEDERKELRESMKSHGYLHTHPVVTFEGKILDGRHRYEMACELGIKFDIVEYQGDDPGGYVMATNVEGRRNLSPGQKAFAIQGVLAVEEERGRQRKAEAGRSAAPGRPAKDGLNSAHLSAGLNSAQEKSPNEPDSSVQAVSPNPQTQKPIEIEITKENTKTEQGRSAQIIADKIGISADSIKKAKAIKTRAPELAEQVISGEKSLNKAYQEMKKAEQPVKEEKLEPVVIEQKEYSPTSRPKHAKQTHRELFSLHLGKLNGVISPLQETYPPEVLAKIAESIKEQEYWLSQLEDFKKMLSKYTTAINNYKKVEN